MRHFLVLAASLAFAAPAYANDSIAVDSQVRSIAQSADHRRTVSTECFSTVLPPSAIFQSRECAAEIAQDSMSHKERVPPTAYVQISALFDAPPVDTAAKALEAAYLSAAVDPNASMKSPPKEISGFSLPFSVASYATVEKTPDGSCEVKDDGTLACTTDRSRKVAVIMYYVDAPPGRFTIDDKPIAMFGITCKIPEGPDFEEEELGCRDIATSFRFL